MNKWTYTCLVHTHRCLYVHDYVKAFRDPILECMIMLHKPDPGWGSRRDRAALYVDDLKVAQLKQGRYSNQNHVFGQLWTQTKFSKDTPVAVYLIYMITLCDPL